MFGVATLVIFLSLVSSPVLSTPSFYSSSSFLDSIFPSHAPRHSPWSRSHRRTRAPALSRDVVARDVNADINTMRERRIALDIGAINMTLVPGISSWLSTIGDDGKWPDSEIDYTTGCDGRRANWPAEDHWVRIETLAAAYRGGVPGAESFVNDPKVLATASRAMDFWFANDMAQPDCLTNGGKGSCPCGTPGFWNSNWFSNVIGTTVLVGDTCLMLGNDSLSATQSGNCTKFLSRAFDVFSSGKSFLAGANILDIAKSGITLGMLTQNEAAIASGYDHVHKEVVLQNSLRADGIRGDGSFGQHEGIIYNGNYGKDYANDVLALEIVAANTQFAAPSESKSAFETLVDGDMWMVYRNAQTGTVHWDFNVLGRMLTFTVKDEQASAGLLINTTWINELGQFWNSDALNGAFSALSANTTDANVGGVKGNRMFYANDYMVHRGPGYVSTLRMYSSRTLNTECLNNQNPFGFHLSDGTLYTYLEGDEYEDIAGMWDWNLIPGTTTDYNNTPLTCDTAKVAGKEDFVGGASDGTIGAAAMRYTNPTTGALAFQKAWFFLDNDVQHVMLSKLSASASSEHPVISVLDQKRHSGDVILDGQTLSVGGNFSNARTLWHDNVGYAFPVGAHVSVDWGTRTGDWGRLGISAAGVQSADLFSAWVGHGRGSDAVLEAPMAYTVFPATTRDALPTKVAASLTNLATVQNDAHVSAVWDAGTKLLAAVFWDAAGGNVTFTPGSGQAALTLSASAGSVVLYRMDTGGVTVSDPTQTTSSVDVTVAAAAGGTRPTGFANGSDSVKVSVSLPSGGAAGQSVSKKLGS
ncbi:polysaccharide lyase family 8 protein [Epithele typhae]|uniref:polysaccharide lyase family 8 protein n=1 Tax=Epithele typhae TaxID=378194 RepID=UPI002007ECC0|nr:polysaccharide lyase family 8 protein [Epithele typhae]KAH9910837.1 polysaccharide lyase family 8 protein [Epithele typhae]